MTKSVQPSLRAIIDNWRQSKEPPVRRLLVALRNNITKLLTASTCCGHCGEAGC